VYGVLLGDGKGGLDSMIGSGRAAMALRVLDEDSNLSVELPVSGAIADVHTVSESAVTDFNELADDIVEKLIVSERETDGVSSEAGSSDSSESVSESSADSGAELDSDSPAFVPPSNPGQIVQWIGKHARTPTVDSPVFTLPGGAQLPSLAMSLTSSPPFRLSTFLNVMCVQPDFHGILGTLRTYPTLVAVAAALRLMCGDTRLEGFFRAAHVMAIVEIAVSQATKPETYKGTGIAKAGGKRWKGGRGDVRSQTAPGEPIATPPLSPYHIHISNIFQRCMFASRMANDVCNRPLGVLEAWSYFDGVAVHEAMVRYETLGARKGAILEGWRRGIFWDVIEAGVGGTRMEETVIGLRRSQSADSAGVGSPRGVWFAPRGWSGHLRGGVPASAGGRGNAQPILPEQSGSQSGRGRGRGVESMAQTDRGEDSVGRGRGGVPSTSPQQAYSRGAFQGRPQANTEGKGANRGTRNRGGMNFGMGGSRQSGGQGRVSPKPGSVVVQGNA
ncbi:hypothetical protein HDU93_003895, partial [Gonapodya sp. JEL0774]